MTFKRRHRLRQHRTVRDVPTTPASSLLPILLRFLSACYCLFLPSSRLLITDLVALLPATSRCVEAKSRVLGSCPSPTSASVQVAPDSLLTDASVYGVRMSIKQDGSSSTQSVNSNHGAWAPSLDTETCGEVDLMRS